MDKKIQNSVIAAVVFALISYQFMYGITNSVLGKVVETQDANKVPTNAGFVLHTIVFALIVFGLMHVLP